MSGSNTPDMPKNVRHIYESMQRAMEFFNNERYHRAYQSLCNDLTNNAMTRGLLTTKTIGDGYSLVIDLLDKNQTEEQRQELAKRLKAWIEHFAQRDLITTTPAITDATTAPGVSHEPEP